LLGAAPPPDDPKSWLQDLGLAHDGIIPPPVPDIIAALLVVHVLGESDTVASEILWTAIEHDIEVAAWRIGRLAYDADRLLGTTSVPIGRWLAQGLQRDPERCRLIAPFVYGPRIPVVWHEAAVEALASAYPAPSRVTATHKPCSNEPGRGWR
jgi:hypothetical protein